MQQVLKDFFEFVPKTLDRREWDVYRQAVNDVRIDNFGCVGTRLLMDWIGVADVSLDFRHRASLRISQFGRLTDELLSRDGVAWMRTRVVNYWEYRLETPGGLLEGAEVGENAYHGEVVADSRWLQAVTPPFNAFADRRTCSEFRSFDRLLEELSRRGAASEVSRTRVFGHVQMLISASPCVSCIGVVRQFRLLYPKVEVRVSGGRPLVPDLGASAFEPRDLSSIAWALAGLSLPNVPCLDSISSSSLTLIQQSKPRGLASMSWAISPLVICDPPLRQALAAAALPRLSFARPNVSVSVLSLPGLHAWSWASSDGVMALTSSSTVPLAVF